MNQSWNKMKHEKRNKRKYDTVDGSSKFQVLEFLHHSELPKGYVFAVNVKKSTAPTLSFLIAIYLSIKWIKCPFVKTHKKNWRTVKIGDSTENIDDSIFPGLIAAVVAAAKSNDTAWFIKVKQDLDGRSESSIDNYGSIIPAGVNVFSR